MKNMMIMALSAALSLLSLVGTGSNAEAGVRNFGATGPQVAGVRNFGSTISTPTPMGVRNFGSC